MLNGKKNVLLAVTGSIAAYKAADIARGFIKKGYTVTVMLTANGAKFITPMTFETLTGSKCLVDTFDRNFKYEVEHIAGHVPEADRSGHEHSDVRQPDRAG